MIFLKDIENISVEALKSNEDYIKKLDEAKKIIKQKVFLMSTNEEKLKYIQEEKTRCKLLKEKNKGLLISALVVSFIALITVVLLGMVKQNLIFFIIWIIAIAILIGSLVIFYIINHNHSKIKYTIMIMAYEEVERKVKNNSEELSQQNNQFRQEFYDIKQEIEMVKQQLKLIYGLQKELKELKKIKERQEIDD